MSSKNKPPPAISKDPFSNINPSPLTGGYIYPHYLSQHGGALPFAPGTSMSLGDSRSNAAPMAAVGSKRKKEEER
jgi:hypothetical protein